MYFIFIVLIKVECYVMFTYIMCTYTIHVFMIQTCRERIRIHIVFRLFASKIRSSLREKLKLFFKSCRITAKVP